MCRPLVVILALLSAVGSLSAAERVEFVDGRSLIVESLHLEGDLFLLVLDSSSTIAVPADRIASVRRYEPARPEDLGREPAVWTRVAGEYRRIIEEASRTHDLDPALVTAMIQVESNFDPFAVSGKGACGLLQLIPSTAERFGVKDVFDPEQNVNGGARYLRWLLDRFDNRTEYALAAYNAGENVVARYDGVPPYRETEAYVRKVLRNVRTNGAQNPSALVNGLVR